MIVNMKKPETVGAVTHTHTHTYNFSKPTRKRKNKEYRYSKSDRNFSYCCGTHTYFWGL